MKRISILAVSFLFAAVFSVSAFAQAGAQPAPSKIGWIDTSAFADEKDGVTKYNNALKALQAEQRLQRDFDYKKKDYDSTLVKRSNEVLGPVSADISKAIQDYAQQKGYSVILDIAALANDNMIAILAMDKSANITKDFIAYYNTRPATTATTTTPK